MSEQRWGGKTWEERRREAVERIYPTGGQKPPPIDYNERGIWRCFRCKDMGEVLVSREPGHEYWNLPASERWVTCPDCGGQAAAKVKAERLMQHSGLDRYLQSRCFENFLINGESPAMRQLQSAAKLGAQGFAEMPKGWLVFHGGTGGGKTHLAAAIANAVIRSGTGVIFQTVPDLLMEIQATFGRENQGTDKMIDGIRKAPVLILDDLDAHQHTDWSGRVLFQIVNHRYNAELPMVVTTNTAPERMDDARLRSRLMTAGLAQLLELAGRDQRESSMRGQANRLRQGDR